MVVLAGEGSGEDKVIPSRDHWSSGFFSTRFCCALTFSENCRAMSNALRDRAQETHSSRQTLSTRSFVKSTSEFVEASKKFKA